LQWRFCIKQGVGIYFRLPANTDRGRNMDNTTKGIISILITYTVWGLQPLYWKMLQHLDIEIVMAARIIWSFVLCGIVLMLRNRRNGPKIGMGRKERAILFVASFMLGGNWILNIYAANSGRIIEASLGHFITPVMTIFAGLLFFKERMSPHEKIALALIISGGIYIIAVEGSIPMVALLLVLSFVTYTILTKQMVSDSLKGFVTQMFFLMPIAVWVIFNKMDQWETIFSLRNGLLLFSTGIFTAIPMVLFAYGVKNIRLSSMGYIQYYAPTISFILGVFVFREAFDVTRLIGFVFIWVGAITASVWPLANNVLKKYQKTA
jgi:chloramphenicol-sensitive protein RarD